MRRIRFLLFVALLPVLTPVAAPAQTLARPGWSGSGLKVEPWWTHAVLYAVDLPRVPAAAGESNLAALTAQLDSLRSLGVDGLTLTHLQQDASASIPNLPLDLQLGSLDELDTLLREASRDNLRILVQLSPTPRLEDSARFWLRRGVAGITLTAPVPEPQLHALRDLAQTFPGERVVIAQAVPGTARSGLTLDTTIATLPSRDAATLRHALEALQTAANAGTLLLQSEPGNSPLDYLTPREPGPAAALATVLLATRANAQLVAGQESGNASVEARAQQEADPNSLLNWYRSLIDLHHGSSAIRTGNDTFLDHDAQNALVWVVRRPQVNAQTPAVIVACNLSPRPLTLSLTADMAALHLRGVFLRTVLRSGPGMGGQSIDAVTLPPYGVFLGELRF